MSEVHYKHPDGPAVVEGDTVDLKENYVVCYDNPDDKPGIENKVAIPKERVVQVTY